MLAEAEETPQPKPSLIPQPSTLIPEQAMLAEAEETAAKERMRSSMCGWSKKVVSIPNAMFMPYMHPLYVCLVCVP